MWTLKVDGGGSRDMQATNLYFSRMLASLVVKDASLAVKYAIWRCMRKWRPKKYCLNFDTRVQLGPWSDVKDCFKCEEKHISLKAYPNHRP